MPELRRHGDGGDPVLTEKLLTARELGAYLGLKPGTILDQAGKRGLLPGYKFGRAVRFDLEEVLATGRPDTENLRWQSPRNVP